MTRVNQHVQALTGLDHDTDLNVLDSGSGPGTHAFRMAELGYRVHAIDISLEMMSQTKRKALGRTLYLEAVVGDVERQPFKDASFDRILSSAILHHFPDPSRVISEYRRMLSETGFLLVAEPNMLNPAVRILTLVRDSIERMIGQTSPFPLRELQSKNERLHLPTIYFSLLARYGLSVRWIGCASRDLGPRTLVQIRGEVQRQGLVKPPQRLSHKLLNWLEFLFQSFFASAQWLTSKILPPPYSGEDLLILASLSP